MKKNYLLYIFLFLANFCLAQTDSLISKLSGFESTDLTSQLIYQIDYRNLGTSFVSHRGDYYHFDTYSYSDSVIFPDFYEYYVTYPFVDAVSVTGYVFFNNNPKKYIYSVAGSSADAYGAIRRYDNPMVFWTSSYIDNIFTERSDTNNIYAVDGRSIIKSTDGGYTWPDWTTPNGISIGFIFYSASPVAVNIIFGYNYLHQLVKSIDTGKTNTVVSTDYWEYKDKIYFDANTICMYGIRGNKFYTSKNNGDTWQYVKTFDKAPLFSNDKFTPGLIYLADGNKLYKSTDYGQSITFVKEFEQIIRGIYKKSGENIVYVALRDKIIKFSEFGSEVVLQKGIQNTLDMFPLKPGNKWIYYTSGDWYDTGYNFYSEYFNAKILDETEIIDGKKYFVMVYEKMQGIDYPPYESKHFYRIDTINAKIYDRYDYKSEETLLYDLFLPANYTYFANGGNCSLTVSDTILFGKNRNQFLFSFTDLHGMNHNLAQGLGLVYKDSYWDFGENKVMLKGCIINGKAYGDTTTRVSVKGEEQGLAREYQLLQNYPNPFNPSTVINYQVAEVGLVSLKVYDILGKEITTLVNEEKTPGAYQVTFNAKTANNVKELSSGVYFYTLKTGNFTETKKMILIR
ncbi:MAG: T9SS type A sorting domain-containing protein [bacterium]